MSRSTRWRRARLRLLVRIRRLRRYARRRVGWARFYRTTSYLKSALWTVPLVAIALELVTWPFLHRLDGILDWRVAALTPSGATALYQTVITLTLSFLVFTFGSLLVAIQVASGQLTPRIIATTLLRNNVVRYSVGLFVFALVLAVGALNRQDEHVLQFVALVVAILGIACIADFLFLIDYAARLLRPVSVVAGVGNEGVEVIKSVYPPRSAPLVADAAPLRAQLGRPLRIVNHVGRAQVVLAVDLRTLVAEARRRDGVLEVLPQVGDFVASEEPLFALYGGAAGIEERKLRSAVAMGIERTLEQDPMFAFRILVDIALKALSPAINDPTTAVLAIDQVHRLLRLVGRRQLRGELIPDQTGTPRVIFRTPNWDDYVHMATNEIRACGASSVQIARRMREMLENLLDTLPAHRHPPVAAEIALLDRAIDAAYPFPEDRALARVADVQGMGGSRARPHAAA